MTINLIVPWAARAGDLVDMDGETGRVVHVDRVFSHASFVRVRVLSYGERERLKEQEQ